VSWPLASFAIVAAALAVGWLAYERARPSARMIALVATLAALAALGRDAFVALPDVKPITAMTLVVGYALGPLAGFTVGAIGMLASNILLGQGPYTPWQMVAWGLVGIIGALVGRLTGRRASRLTLAVACALAALVAKELMNVYSWTIGGVYTPAALLAQVASGLPFDITDVVASFLFGLAFAPELARVLARARSRMEVSWVPPAGGEAPAEGALRSPRARRGAAALGLLLALVALAAHAGHPMRASAASVELAAAASRSGAAELSYLARAQNADGGFGEAAGRKTSELYSAWAAMGLAASGEDPLSLARDGHSVLDALRSEASTLEGVGDVERTILALHACGVGARSLAGVQLEAKLLAARRADGSFSDQVNLTAFAIFALRAEGRASGDRLVQGAAHWLAREQDADGGFGFATRGSGSEVDDTAAAVQALVSAGSHARAVVERALSYITHAQNSDGGFPEGTGGESNAQSTAWAVQGLVAAGRNVEAIRRSGGRSPLGYLRSLVGPDGSVRYSRTSTQTPVWVTAQALTALARKPFPIAPVHTGHTAAGGGSPSTSATAGAQLPQRAGRARGAQGPTEASQSGTPGAGHTVQANATGPPVGRREASALGAVVLAVEQGLASVATRALLPIGISESRAAARR
jgi:energy-coupling factor transport system substrate-specific component